MRLVLEFFYTHQYININDNVIIPTHFVFVRETVLPENRLSGYEYDITVGTYFSYYGNPLYIKYYTDRCTPRRGLYLIGTRDMPYTGTRAVWVKSPKCLGPNEILIPSYHSDQNVSALVQWYEVYKHTALLFICVIKRDATDSRNT